MTEQHPDLADEQAYIDYAYECLERSREDAWKLRDLHEGQLGGTFQARYERDVFDEALVNRLTRLDLGDAALVFGRIDRYAESPEELESFHIGRLAVADENSENPRVKELAQNIASVQKREIEQISRWREQWHPEG